MGAGERKSRMEHSAKYGVLILDFHLGLLLVHVYKNLKDILIVTVVPVSGAILLRGVLKCKWPSVFGLWEAAFLEISGTSSYISRQDEIV